MFEQESKLATNDDNWKLSSHSVDDIFASDKGTGVIEGTMYADPAVVWTRVPEPIRYLRAVKKAVEINNFVKPNKIIELEMTSLFMCMLMKRRLASQILRTTKQNIHIRICR